MSRSPDYSNPLLNWIREHVGNRAFWWLRRQLPVKAWIHYSLDRSLYYVTRTDFNPYRGDRGGFDQTMWLSVGTISGPSPKREPTNVPNIFEPFDLEITKSTGEVYYRKAWDFRFFKVKSGETERLSRNTDLYKDYAAAHGWPA